MHMHNNVPFVQRLVHCAYIPPVIGLGYTRDDLVHHKLRRNGGSNPPGHTILVVYIFFTPLNM